MLVKISNVLLEIFSGKEILFQSIFNLICATCYLPQSDGPTEVYRGRAGSLVSYKTGGLMTGVQIAVAPLNRSSGDDFYYITFSMF